jgi:elongation factor 1 alpha-like protein
MCIVAALDLFPFLHVSMHTPAGIPLRMPVHDVFKARQGGVCVGGKLEGGALKPGSKVLLVPGCETATVKSLEVNGQVRGQSHCFQCSRKSCKQMRITVWQHGAASVVRGAVVVLQSWCVLLLTPIRV